MKDRASWQRPSGLTDERRVQLQATVQAWREAHTVTICTSSQYILSADSQSVHWSA